MDELFAPKSTTPSTSRLAGRARASSLGSAALIWPRIDEPDGVGHLEDEAEAGADQRRGAPADLEHRPEQVASLRRREDRPEVADDLAARSRTGSVGNRIESSAWLRRPLRSASTSTTVGGSPRRARRRR